MNKITIPSIRTTIRDNYITTNYNNKQAKELVDLVDDGSLKEVCVNDLQELTVEGGTCGSYRREDGKLYFAYTDNNAHTIINGATGSGKTCCYVDNNIYFLSTKMNKANLFITDPKGELLSKHGKRLENEGYRIHILNFLNVSYSNSWNMLSEIYDMWHELPHLKEKAEYHNSLNGFSENEYIINEALDCFDEEYGFWSYKDHAFSNEKQLDDYLNVVRAEIENDISDLISQVIFCLIPDSMISKIDGSWTLGARSILEGLIYLLLEDSDYKGSGVTRSNFNLSTISDYYNEIRSECINCGANTVKPLLSSRILQHKSSNDKSIRILRSYLENAPTTTRSYIGIFDNLMHKYFTTKYSTLCNETTIDVESDDKPFAIFLSTRDYEKSDYQIASIFIEYIYKKMVDKSASSKEKIRETHFMLDEFANISNITSFDSKISTSRSRNIWFEMIIQSYAQIDLNYGHEVSTNISDNVAQHFFLGSQNYETIQRFSRECGKTYIPSLENVMNPKSNALSEVPVIPESKLEKVQIGEYYGRIKGLPVICGHFEMSFHCPELETEKQVTPQELGFKSTPYNDEKFKYSYLFSNKTMEQYVNADYLLNCFRNA